MTRYTKDDVRKMAMNVTVEARALGIIKETETVEFQAGSATNGVSAYMYVQDNMEPGQHRSSTGFLPEFTLKDTLSTCFKTLEATFKALNAARRSFD